MSFLQKKSDVSEEDISKLLTAFEKLPECCLWSKVTKDDFTVKRFAMGFVNDISCCELTAEARHRLVKGLSDMTAIVVKFVTNFDFLDISRLEFAATNTLMSQLAISPRVLYIDETCFISEYIESRTYKVEDDLEPETVKLVARKLAAIHSATPPLSCTGFKSTQKMFGDDPESAPPEFRAVMEKEFLKSLDVETPEIREKYYSFFEAADIDGFTKLTRKLTLKVASPLVFSHSDFNRGNRLIRELAAVNGKPPRKELFIVDFDFSTYNYRGLDLGRYFSNYRHTDDMFGDEGFPSDTEMALFLGEYRAECARIQGPAYLEAEENSLEQLIREVKVFTLSAYGDYLFCLMMYGMNPSGPKKDYFLQSAYNRCSAYEKLVKQVTADGTIDLVLGKTA